MDRQVVTDSSQEAQNSGKKRFRDWVGPVLVVVGIVVLLVPIIQARFIEQSENEKVVKAFEEYSLGEQSQNGDQSRVSLFQNEDAPIGVIYLPTIDIALPIYDKLSEYALSKGVGAMKGYDDISGDVGTVCALSSHSGLSANGLFTNLNKIKKKEHFYIRKSDGKINQYKVYDIKTVLPNDTSRLKKVDGQATAILITCENLEGINTHRRLVFGKLMGEIDKIPSGTLVLSTYEKIVLGVFAIIAFGFLIRMLAGKRKKRKQRT